jgi:hypothetical protein
VHLRGQPIRQAEGAQPVGAGEDGEAVREHRPEVVVVVEVVELGLDLRRRSPGQAAIPQHFQRLAGEVLEGDPVGLGIRGDRGGRQVDRDQAVAARLEQALGLTATGDVYVQGHMTSLTGYFKSAD